MFKNMKAVPKAIILVAIIFVPITIYVKFGPKDVPPPTVETVVPKPVPAETTQPVAPVEPAPAENDAGSDAGMKALLNKGKK